MTLVTRASNLILRPRSEWVAIAAEPLDVGQVYRRYVAPLSAIPIVAGFIGRSLVGYSVPGLPPFREPIVGGILSGLAQFVLGLAFVYVLALVIDALAPLFGARRGMGAAFKLAAYGLTPAWVAGIFAIVPGLTIFTMLGLQFVYVIHVGLPRLMAVPAERALPYTILTALVAILLAWLAAAIGLQFIPAPERVY